jgi:DNA invertase Pin-like site-specific DNA recombinase
MATAAIYARLSKNNDGTKDSTDRQIDRAHEIAMREDWTIAAEIVEDGRSAYRESMSRPGFQEVLSLIESDSVDIVIAREQARYARRSQGWARLRDLARAHGVELWTFAGPINIATAEGRMASGVNGVVDEYWSDKISEAVTEAADAKRARGQLVVSGYAPYGFAWTEIDSGNGRRHKDLRPVANEVAQISRMLGWVVKDGLSLRQIAERLNDEEVPTAKGGALWRPNAVSAILKHPRLIGRYADDQGRDIGPASWPAVVDEVLWTEAQAVLRRRGVAHGSQAHDRHTLKRWLRRQLICGKCGHAMEGSGKADRPTYRCPPPSMGGCGQILVVASGAETAVVDALTTLLDDPKVRTALAQQLTESPAAVDHLAKIEVLDARLAELGAMAARGELLPEVVAGAAVEIDAERTELREAMVAAAAPPPVPIPDDLGSAWDELTGEERSEILSIVAEKVIVNPAGKKNGPKFDPERIEIVWRE